MSKKQNRLSTFFLYLKLLKKWGFKQKKKIYNSKYFYVNSSNGNLYVSINNRLCF